MNSIIVGNKNTNSHYMCILKLQEFKSHCFFERKDRIVLNIKQRKHKQRMTPSIAST